MPNYTKNCSFLHANYTETYNVVKKFVKTLFYGEKHSFFEWTIGAGAHWNCLFETIPMFTNNKESKETYFEIYTKQIACP